MSILCQLTWPRLTLFIISVFAIVIAFLPYSFGGYNEFASEILNTMHLPAFAIFTLSIFANIPKHFGNRRYLITFAISIVLAIAIEWIQARIGREASWGDVTLDLVGIILALSGIYLWQKKQARLRWGYAFFALGVIIFFSYPIAIKGYSIYWQQQQFPMFGDFESNMDLHLWRTQGGTPDNPTRIELQLNYATHGKQALRITTGQGDWGGICFSAYDSDWSNYKYFTLDLFNPSPQAFNFFIRIDDSDKRAPRYYEHRFNYSQKMNPGMNKIRIPVDTIATSLKSRNLNIKSIRRFILYLEKNRPSRIFYIDNIRLE